MKFFLLDAAYKTLAGKSPDKTVTSDGINSSRPTKSH